MAPIPDVADGCANILVQLLCFLGWSFPRSPAVDEAVAPLLLVLAMAYIARVIVEHFAIVVLAYLHLAAPAPASATAASSVCLGPGRFVVLVSTLISVWLFVFAVLLAAFVFLDARMRGLGMAFSWNVLSQTLLQLGRATK